MTAVLSPGNPLLVSREWPWGLAFVRDSIWTEPVPTGWLATDPAVATRGEIVIKILHQVDGKATLEISLLPPAGLTLVGEYEIDLPSGTVVVGDPGQEQIETANVDPGSWNATVWMDYPEHATRAVICLRPTN